MRWPTPHPEYAGLTSRVLLLGGTRSSKYLDVALAELAAELPRGRRVTLDGTTHEAPEDEGCPLAVARILRAIFTAP